MKKPGKTNVNVSRRTVVQTPGIRDIVSTPLFAKVFPLACLAILFLTTFFWALLSAKVQQSNADQIVPAYLFQHASTIHTALIPGEHTFLLKWPLYYLIGLLGSSGAVITTITVGVVLVTVMGFAAVLQRIEKRPLVFGGLCLALASVLLMIPAEPYAGALLPVNMAMLSTRNLEYILYIVSVALLVKAPRMRSWKFLLAVSGMTLLFASDKLFLSISVLGALTALICYALVQNWKFVSLSVNWLIASLVSGALATITLALINASGLIHIVGQSSVGPYGLVHGIHDLGLGIIFAVLGLFTNFGANPASNYTIIRNIPAQAFHGLASPSGITFLINLVISLVGIAIAYRFMRASLAPSRGKTRSVSTTNVSIILLWTALATIAVFVLTNHAYAVDARYLGMALFSVFIAVAAYVRTRRWQPERVVYVSVVLVVGIILGLLHVVRIYNNEVSALSTDNQRNATVAQVLRQHPVDTLVGSYWRVIPTRLLAHGNIPVTPLAGCTQPTGSLNSTAWQLNLHASFSYLLSLDTSATNFPSCSIKQIVASYGRPNQSSLIAGTLSNPKELLLFYDHGIRSAPLHPVTHRGAPATILPIGLSELPVTTSPQPTVMNIVAHQDDDLLFMNPDLTQSIKAGDCIRTIYVTAGDGGQGQFYWLSREQGSEAAYSHMIGLTNPDWIQRIVQVANHEYITVANPKGNKSISLIFMHLPDGDIQGQGFASSNYQSLAKLNAGTIKTINSIDGQSYYSSPQLVAALTSLMHTYQPAEIRTQADYVSKQFPDHSDHITVGSFVQKAYAQYEKQQYNNQVTIPIKFYIGYPIHSMPANVSGAQLAQKEATFLAYAKYDGAVCHTIQQCQATPTYGAYLTREYQYKN
jgi:LmbE family N-acetylglucosaminyl deacetylase